MIYIYIYIYMIPALGPQTTWVSRLKKPSKACINIFYELWEEPSLVTTDPSGSVVTGGSWASQV